MLMLQSEHFEAALRAFLGEADLHPAAREVAHRALSSFQASKDAGAH